MKSILTAAVALMALSATAAFAEGDAERGAKDFNKCKACHSIISPEGEVIVKGGKTGPNLWGVIGRTAGTQPEFDKYGDSLTALGATGFVWTEDLIFEYAKDPKAFLIAQLDDAKAKSMMTFKLKDASNIAAYLAQFGAADGAAADGEHHDGEHHEGGDEHREGDSH